jgi:hypothetical protein
MLSPRINEARSQFLATGFAMEVLPGRRVWSQWYQPE